MKLNALALRLKTEVPCFPLQLLATNTEEPDCLLIWELPKTSGVVVKVNFCVSEGLNDQQDREEFSGVLSDSPTPHNLGRLRRGLVAAVISLNRWLPCKDLWVSFLPYYILLLLTSEPRFQEYKGFRCIFNCVLYNHSTQAFSHREAGNKADGQSLIHLKPWFRQSGKTSLSARLGRHTCDIQFRS